MTRQHADSLLRRVVEMMTLLEIEPTWITEAGLSLAVVLWGIGALLTCDLTVQRWGLVLPIVVIVLGLARMWAFRYDRRGSRVLFAMASAMFIAWCLIGMLASYAITPNEGFLAGAFVCDALTLGKFSLPYVREWLEIRHDAQ